MKKLIFLILYLCGPYFVNGQTVITHDDSVIVAKFVFGSSFDSRLFPCMIQTGYRNIVAIRSCIVRCERVEQQCRLISAYIDSVESLPSKGYYTLKHLEELKEERKRLSQGLIFATAQIVQLCMCPRKNRPVLSTDKYGD